MLKLVVIAGYSRQGISVLYVSCESPYISFEATLIFFFPLIWESTSSPWTAWGEVYWCFTNISRSQCWSKVTHNASSCRIFNQKGLYPFSETNFQDLSSPSFSVVWSSHLVLLNIFPETLITWVCRFSGFSRTSYHYQRLSRTCTYPEFNVTSTHSPCSGLHSHVQS